MKTPKIRFKGFSQILNNRLLWDALKEYNEQFEKDWTYEHVSLTKEWIIPKSARYDRDSLVQDNHKKYRITHLNDICYNPANLKFWVICRNKYKDSIFSPIYVTFKVGENDAPSFIEYYVKRDYFINESLKNQEGTVYERMAVKPQYFLKMNIHTPHKQEQEKIWSLFEQLDSHICKNQQKLEKLKNMKQSFLQKLFPKDWSALPELRFKGFEGDWVERKLGELAEWFEYWLNAPATTFDWNNKYIRITDIDETSNLFLQTDITSPNCNLIQADKYKLSYWDILFARTWASVWKSYMYLNSDGLVYYAWFLIKASVKEKKNTKFIFLNTLTEKYKKYIKITSQRSWQPWVNAIEYSLYKFMTTSVPEQEKIWAFFQKLDTQITQQSQKLEKLKNIKQSLLEKMFI